MADEEFQIIIEGRPYTVDDLSFREQRAMRSTVRDLTDDPDADLADADLMDFIPALVYVVTRRDRPDFTLDEALDIKFGDIFKATNGNDSPPTKARAKPKAKTA